MPRAVWVRPLRWRVAGLGRVMLLWALLIAPPVAGGSKAWAQGVAIDELLSAVVRIKTFINPEGRTTEMLGREREGSAIVIGSDGLILTIGYLMVEAHSAAVTTNDGRTVAADVVGYDHETGFGLLRAASALKVRPLPLGSSASLQIGDKVLVASGGGLDTVGPATVAAKRLFAGSWEYLLDEAIFTSPPHPAWSGAALITRDGKLAGVGSLIVKDTSGIGGGLPGNMFVPIDRLPPILAELIADGRVSGPPKPWLGMTTEEVHGKLTVQRVAKGGPAEKAGVEAGDTITAIAGKAPGSLAELYRMIWAHGTAGAVIRVELMRKGGRVELELKSMSRLDHLKLRSTF